MTVTKIIYPSSCDANLVETVRTLLIIWYNLRMWAQALASQDNDAELKAHFVPISEQLASNEAAIVKELNDVQGSAKDIDGYYFADDQLASEAMRPSAILNGVLGSL